MSKEINISGFRVFMWFMAAAWFYQSILDHPDKQPLIICFILLMVSALHRIEEKLDKLNKITKED